ncbi:leucine-rich receptor-like protein kinase family protein [Striga asiatica]|uniref:Leucine-rich receptor-like protein kinase family protein n=1 Tax=Striga asiatica TaxID=4170 RepID=A0A5A7QNS3_STRAF|nr:leucine-rich receptor-like protein kinase family protein [Striga asiatica]
MQSFLVVFLFICSFVLLVKSMRSTLSDDVVGLLVFKASLEDPHGKLSSWNDDDDDSSCCTWTGVKCNPKSNRVSELVLDSFGLSGKLSRGLLKLRSLRKLSLANNNLTGGLNFNLSQLPHLKFLNLSENRLSGSVPSDFFTPCGSLTSISLAKNNFSGPLPLGIGNCPLLETIDLSWNKLSGGLPSTMQNLSSCSNLILGGNGFESSVPQWIGEMRSLKILDLSKNSFTGQLPDSLAKLQSLKILNVSKNALSGNLPSWVFRLGLEQVLFSNNRFSGRLENVFDLSIENSRKKVAILDLSQNQFFDIIPAAVGDFINLKVLNMARNILLGSIPVSIGQLKLLSVLDLSENQLNGSIPSEIGQLESLKSLYLDHNQITGHIPLSLSNLTRLEKIDLSFNKLSGSLPNQLSNLIHLHSFNISHNNLQGKLPSGSFFNTIPISSISGNPSLCAGPTNSSCSAVLPKPIVLNPNSTFTPPNPIGSNSFSHGKKVLTVSALIAICAAGAIFVGVIFVTVLNIRVRSSALRLPVVSFSSSSSSEDNNNCGSLGSSGRDSGKLVLFSGASHDFGNLTSSGGARSLLGKDCEIGRGGFGPVYRASLGDGRPVAVRRLAFSGPVGPREDFEKLARKLGKARHVNLLGLVGYYWAPSLQLLIYEFAPGGSLHGRLHECSDENCLSWDERFDVILGTARGLARLHEMNVIHYNLKSSNVLIGESGQPKVADFGLAQFVMREHYNVKSSAVGYVAPEVSCETVILTEKCDVYGFGVLVLEVVMGRRPVEYTEDDVVVLCEMVRGAILEEGKVEECVDFRLRGEFRLDEVLRVVKLGLICTSQVPSSRPGMDEVVRVLELVRRREGMDESDGLSSDEH